MTDRGVCAPPVAQHRRNRADPLDRPVAPCPASQPLGPARRGRGVVPPRVRHHARRRRHAVRRNRRDRRPAPGAPRRPADGPRHPRRVDRASGAAGRHRRDRHGRAGPDARDGRRDHRPRRAVRVVRAGRLGPRRRLEARGAGLVRGHRRSRDPHRRGVGDGRVGPRRHPVRGGGRRPGSRGRRHDGPDQPDRRGDLHSRRGDRHLAAGPQRPVLAQRAAGPGRHGHDRPIHHPRPVRRGSGGAPRTRSDPWGCDGVASPARPRPARDGRRQRPPGADRLTRPPPWGGHDRGARHE